MSTSKSTDSDLQRNVTSCHGCRIQIPLGIILVRLLLTVRQAKLCIIDEYCTMLYTFYVSRMKGEDEGTYYLLKMSDLCKNYVLQGADEKLLGLM